MRTRLDIRGFMYLDEIYRLERKYGGVPAKEVVRVKFLALQGT